MSGKPTYEELEKRIQELEQVESERKRAEETFRESEERFAVVMDGLDALVYVADLHTYEILFLNKYGRNIWGDIVGDQCWKTLQSGQAGPCEFCTNDRLLDANGEPTGVYVWELQNTVDGKWYECRDQVIHWMDGRLVRLEIAINITERKRGEEQLTQSRNLMQYIIFHARSAIAVHDTDLNYVYVSEKYLNDYRVKERDVIGKHHYEVFPDLPQKWRDVHQRALAGEVLSAEEDPYFREDGSVDWTRWECRPWYESDG